MEAARQGPREIVPDAYAEHVRTLRAREDVEKMATLRIPEKHMQAVFLVIKDVLDSLEKPLSEPHKSKWDSITRSILSSIRDAE